MGACSSRPREAYVNLETGVASTAAGGQPKSCYDQYKGLVAAIFLSVLTALLFLLRSGPLASSMCSNVILIISEGIKFAVAIGYVVSHKQTPKLFQSIPLAFVPVTSYVCVNLLSFWALKYVHASLGALMSQIKLPATAVFSRFFLGRAVSFDRTMALGTIFLGSLAIAAYGQMQKETEGDANDDGLADVAMVTYILATIALLTESCLSAATGVFTQWVFKGSMDMLWVRNAQFGLLSIGQYAVLQWVVEDNTGECQVYPDARGLTVAALYATMGISVALTLLWLGAIEKTIASVSAVVLTTLGDHLFVLHTAPTLLELTVSAVIINGILHFSLTK